MGIKRPGSEADDRPPGSFEFDGYSRYQEIHFHCANPEFFYRFSPLSQTPTTSRVCVCVRACL